MKTVRGANPIKTEAAVKPHHRSQSAATSGATSKTCKVCAETKPASECVKGRNLCKKCDAVRSRFYYYAHREKRLATIQDYYYLNREECIARVIARRLRKKFNITEESNYQLDPVVFGILA